MLDLTGRVFGRLTVVGNRISHNWKSYWGCRCECGTVKHVESAWAEELGLFRTSIQSRRNRGFFGDILVAPSRNMLGYVGPRCVKYMEDYTQEELQQFKRKDGPDGRQD